MIRSVCESSGLAIRRHPTPMSQSGGVLQRYIKTKQLPCHSRKATIVILPAMSNPEAILTSSIAVIGAGSVGSTVAYTLINKPIASEVLLVDPKEETRDAHIRDLSDATYHGTTSTLVRVGTHKEAGQCDIIVVTAGAKQKKGSAFPRHFSIDEH